MQIWSQNTRADVSGRMAPPVSEWWHSAYLIFAQNTLKLFFKEKQDHDTVHISILSNMDNQHICTSCGA